MLLTNLKHVNSKEELQDLIKNNEKVAVSCGSMRPICIPVYDIFEIY